MNTSYYSGDKGKKYFHRRFDKKHEMGRILQSRYFLPYCNEDRVLLDFGCGDGTILRQLPAKMKIGVELNPECHRVIENFNTKSASPIIVYNKITSVSDDSVDLIISNHCLEHVPSPVDVIYEFLRVLKKNGQLILVLPFDDWRNPQNKSHNKDDKDHHLFTWSPLNISNLLYYAGFSVEVSKMCHTAWSPKFLWIYRLFGEKIFNFACFIFSLYSQRREVFCLSFKK